MWWGIGFGAFFYLLILFTLGLMTLRKGHWVMFLIGIPLPIFWLVGALVQETNCHPFRHGRWLFMHNGFIGDLAKVKRDLVLAVDPSLYPSIEGSSDTEVFFHLALTFGLEDDPPAAVEAAVGLIEEVGKKHGVEHPIQMTVATSNGETVWAFRYSSERDSRSLFYSTDVPTVRGLYPELEV